MWPFSGTSNREPSYVTEIQPIDASEIREAAARVVRLEDAVRDLEDAIVKGRSLSMERRAPLESCFYTHTIASQQDVPGMPEAFRSLLSDALELAKSELEALL